MWNGLVFGLIIVNTSCALSQLRYESKAESRPEKPKGPQLVIASFSFLSPILVFVPSYIKRKDEQHICTSLTLCFITTSDYFSRKSKDGKFHKNFTFVLSWLQLHRHPCPLWRQGGRLPQRGKPEEQVRHIRTFTSSFSVYLREHS